jgi:hypothetical protein
METRKPAFAGRVQDPLDSGPARDFDRCDGKEGRVAAPRSKNLVEEERVGPVVIGRKAGLADAGRDLARRLLRVE